METENGKQPYNILISSIGTATSVNLIKLLHSTGKYKIIGMDINPIGYTSGSLLADQFYQVDGFNSEQYIQQIENIIDKEKIDLFIPIHDLEIEKIILSGFHHKHCKFLLPSREIVDLFSNKRKAAQAIKDIGLDIPQIITAESDLIKSDSYIARPIRSVGSKGIKFFTGADEALLSYFNREDYFVQEKVSGKEFTVDVICDQNAQPLLIIPRERIEVKAGVATKVKITNDQNLIGAVKKIVSKFRLPGFSNIQFIQHEDKYDFIELNYRFGGMSIASVLSSYNYVDDFIESMLTGDIKASDLEKNMQSVKWNAIVCRYYEEMIYQA